MPYVSSFVYCDNVPILSTPQGPQQQIINPLEALKPIAIPGNFTFCVSCTIAGLELGKEHSVQIAFYDSDEKFCCDFVNTKFLAPMVLPDGKMPQALQMNVDVRNVVLRNPGIHSTQVKVDGEIIGIFKINVVKGQEHA